MVTSKIQPEISRMSQVDNHPESPQTRDEGVEPGLGSVSNASSSTETVTDSNLLARDTQAGQTDVHDDLSALRPPSMVTKRLLHEVAKLEKAVIGISSPSDMDDDEDSPIVDEECDAALDDLNQAISEVEALVAALQKQVANPEPPASSECFDCVSLRCEIDSLQAELSASKSRIAELEKGVKPTTPESPGPKSPPAVSASSRLRNVTAALSKALHARTSSS